MKKSKHIQNIFMIAIIVIIFLSVSLVYTPLPVKAATSANNFSVSVWTGASDQILNYIEDLGVGWVRIENGANWRLIEYRKGQYDWRTSDRMVNWARANNIEVFMDVFSTPNWANGGKGLTYPPDNMNDYKNFVYQVVKRYNLKVVNIWSEPYGFFSGTIDQYVALTKAGYEGAKQANPNCKVLGNYGYSPRHIYDSGFPLDELVKRGFFNYIDALSCSTYTGGRTTGPEGSLRYWLQDLKDYLVSKGKPDMEFWDGSWGYGVGPGLAAAGDWTLEEQADLVSRHLKVTNEFSWVKFTNYWVIDGNGESGITALIDPASGVPRPSYHTYKGNIGSTPQTSTPPEPTEPISTPSNSLIFDFGTSNSPVVSGYNRVTPTTLYSSVSGFGWSSKTNLDSRDRGSPNYLLRDFVFSSNDCTFNVDLAEGNYLITVTIGDQRYGHDKIDVYAEGALKLNDVSVNAGQFAVKTFAVTLSDGELNIRFHDDGGSDSNWVINSIEITKGTTQAINSQPSEFWRGYDFGTSSSPLEPDHIRITHINTRDRGSPDTIRRDLIFDSSDITFVPLNIPNGNYLITVTIGDQRYGHDKIDVYAEGALKLNDVSVNAGQFAVKTFAVTLSDGELNIRFHDDGGSDSNWVINSLIIEAAP